MEVRTRSGRCYELEKANLGSYEIMHTQNIRENEQLAIHSIKVSTNSGPTKRPSKANGIPLNFSMVKTYKSHYCPRSGKSDWPVLISSFNFSVKSQSIANPFHLDNA